MPSATMLRPARRPALLLALLALAGGAAIAGSDASGQAPGTRTIMLTETERGATFTHIRNTRSGRRANMPGDVLAFTYPLLDAGGARVGKLSMGCTTTTGSRDFRKSTMTCVGVLALRDGNLMVQGNVGADGSTTTAAIIGGTGAYAGARGQVTSEPSRGGNVDTITLIG